MLRFVLDPAGMVVPDFDERLPGRGVWLTAERGVIEKALAGQTFARAFRRLVKPAPGLLQSLEAGMLRRCVESLGLARRAGMVVSGFEQVAEHLRTGGMPLVLVASDASRTQSRRLSG